MKTFVFVAEIIVALTLILVILIQARGTGLGGIFGGWGTPSFRTRRGIEQTLFRFTVILAVVFILIAAFSARLGS